MSPTIFKLYIGIALKEWTRKCEKMEVRRTKEKYIFDLLFVEDQVVIIKGGEDIEHLIKKLLEEYSE